MGREKRRQEKWDEKSGGRGKWVDKSGTRKVGREK